MTDATTSQTSGGSVLVIDPAGSFADQLAELKAQAAAAAERRTAARYALDENKYDTAREITADLVKYRDDITFRKPGATPVADRPARERELADEFGAALRKHGAVLKAIGNGGGIEIVDPAISRDFDLSGAEALKANRAVLDFEREHRDEIAAEVSKREADAIKLALQGDDAQAIREAISPTPEKPAALTTNDLTGRRRVTVPG